MSSNEHRSTSRVLDILELLSSSDSGYTLTELSNLMLAPKSSIFPIVHTMQNRHYIEINPTTLKYNIGINTFAVGSTYIKTHNILSYITEEMKILVNNCEETCSLSILDNSNSLYLAKIESPQSLRIVSYVGKRVPANCTALGKCLLCEYTYEMIENMFPKGLNSYAKNTIIDMDIFYEQLKEVRKTGFAVEIGEFDDQIQCIAVPIYKNTDVALAVSVSIPIFRVTDDKLSLIKEELFKLKNKVEFLLRNYANDADSVSFIDI